MLTSGHLTAIPTYHQPNSLETLQRQIGFILPSQYKEGETGTKASQSSCSQPRSMEICTQFGVTALEKQEWTTLDTEHPSWKKLLFHSPKGQQHISCRAKKSLLVAHSLRQQPEAAALETSALP